MLRKMLGLLVALTVTGCGGGGGGGADSGADTGADASAPCSTDEECNDGNPCDGEEQCTAVGCQDGSRLPDGVECDADGDTATTDYCVDLLCTPSRCGDGVVDADAGEQCDDKNDVDGDGCDTDCTPSCAADTDCDDMELCNGAETCNTTTHACEPGDRASNGTECFEGAGVCADGVCRPRDCTVDGDCSDGNACNGNEVCSAGVCAAGAPKDCSDGNACTSDSCDALSGACVNRLIDEDSDGNAPTFLGDCGTDCNDMDGDVYEGAPEACDLKDNDCDLAIDEGEVVAWYADCDDDGWAAAGATSITACNKPAASLTGCSGGGDWTTRAPGRSPDCNDANATVFPSQSVFQTSPIAGAPAATDFDYNCDTVEQPERATNTGACLPASSTCTVVPGWIGAAPACGAGGNWVAGCIPSFSGFPPRVVACSVIPTSLTQACR